MAMFFLSIKVSMKFFIRCELNVFESSCSDKQNDVTRVLHINNQGNRFIILQIQKVPHMEREPIRAC